MARVCQSSLISRLQIHCMLRMPLPATADNSTLCQHCCWVCQELSEAMFNRHLQMQAALKVLVAPQLAPHLVHPILSLVLQQRQLPHGTL